jgi:hypothetical protein
VSAPRTDAEDIHQLSVQLFALKLASGKVTGTASFLGVQGGILEGKLERDDLSFTTRTEQMEGAVTREAKHIYRGKIADDRIHFVMQTEGGFSPQAPVEFLATRHLEKAARQALAFDEQRCKSDRQNHEPRCRPLRNRQSEK